MGKMFKWPCCRPWRNLLRIPADEKQQTRLVTTCLTQMKITQPFFIKITFFCRHYYYEKEALVYGFYEENQWKFGLKDRGQNNGYSIKLSKSEGQCVSIDVAKNHL